MNLLFTHRPALHTAGRDWTYAELQPQVDEFASLLKTAGVRVLATLLDNSAAWVVADLAAAQAGVVHVPLPVFFTRPQMAHALAAAGVDALLAPAATAAAWPQAPQQACPQFDEGGQQLILLRLPGSLVHMPAGTAKITFTSGTTGAPKGVCLSQQAMQRVSDGLVQAMEFLDIRRHLNALPFAVLLENIAGLMAPLSRGASCVVLPLQELGLQGSSSFDVVRFHGVVAKHQPDSVILLPQMLRAWVAYLQQSGQLAPASLRMVAVGGAAVGAPLILAAQKLGIPAFEGYGLSEGASVQSLNLPGADRPGSAGRLLPHAQMRVAADGELEIGGSLFSAYLGDSTPAPNWWPTGDLGTIDTDGFVHVQGRKKNVLITSFGRNVSPEWVETAIRCQSAIGQAVVFGEAQPALSAVLWPVKPDLPDAALQAAVNSANAGLPDYAQIRHWVRASAAFSPETGLATANGRPQRQAILQLHADALGFPGPSITNQPDMKVLP